MPSETPSGAGPTRIAYLTGEYPRASDTFIQREVAALRDLGHEVLTCSIRTTGAEHLVGPEQREEHARTFKVLDTCKSPLRLLRAHRLVRRRKQGRNVYYALDDAHIRLLIDVALQHLGHAATL